MIELVMLRISQKSSSLSAINNLYASLEGEKVTIKRIFDPRISFSGDDLVIEGKLTNFVKKLSFDLPKILALKFKIDNTEVLEQKLIQMSVMNMKTEFVTSFFGVTLVDYSAILTRLRLPEKERLLPLLLRSPLGAYFTTLMPVKVKGVVVINRKEKTIEFILPTQRIETIAEWLKTLQTVEKIDFDVLVNIYQNFDPLMRKNMEAAMEWIDLNLPDLVARYHEVEEIDAYLVYKNALSLL